ncbi:hypothetical protein ACLOJK_003848 [Asimina triloba]
MGRWEVVGGPSWLDLVKEVGCWLWIGGPLMLDSVGWWLVVGDLRWIEIADGGESAGRRCWLVTRHRRAGCYGLDVAGWIGLWPWASNGVRQANGVADG